MSQSPADPAREFPDPHPVLLGATGLRLLLRTAMGQVEPPGTAAEAAKTPEQREAEAQAPEVRPNLYRNQIIAKQAQEMLATLDRFVPETTVHYAVEDARRALTTLITQAEKGSITTVAALREA